MKEKINQVIVMLMTIWSLLLGMFVTQCSSDDDTRYRLSAIEHEVRMLNYK
jgi:hypothetical protein